jgi:hypothetical protein
VDIGVSGKQAASIFRAEMSRFRKTLGYIVYLQDDREIQGEGVKEGI